MTSARLDPNSPTSPHTVYQSLSTISADPLVEIRPFLTWLDESVLHNHKSKFEHGLGLIGGLLGITSTLASYSMGSGFGRFLADHLRLSVIREPIAVAMGGATITAIGTLLAMPNRRALQNIARTLEGKTALPQKQDRLAQRRTVFIIEELFALCAGIPFYMLLRENIERNVIPWAAMIASYFACLETARNFSNYVFNKYSAETEEVLSARLRLQYKFRKSMEVVTALTPDNLTQLASTLRTIHEQNRHDQTTLEEIALLAHLVPMERIDQVLYEFDEEFEIEQAANLDKKLIVLDSLTLTLGFFATIVLIQYGRATADLWAEKIGGPDAWQAFVAGAITFFGITANIVFNMAYTTMRANQIYHHLKAGHYKPSARAIGAQSLAITAAISNTFIAMSSAKDLAGYLLIAPSFLSPALAQAMGFDALLDEVEQGYREHCKPTDPESIRQRLLLQLQKIYDSFISLDQTQLLALDKCLEKYKTDQDVTLSQHRLFGHRKAPEVSIEIQPLPSLDSHLEPLEITSPRYS